VLYSLFAWERAFEAVAGAVFVSIDVVTIGVVCADVMVRPVDGAPPGGHLWTVPEMTMSVGGLAGVTASVLARLGVKSAMIGQLGNDGFGDYIATFLESQGVGLEAMQRTDAHHTSASVVLVAADGERAILHHVGTTAAITPASLDFDYIAQARIFHWGGPPLTPGMDGEAAGEVMARVKALGVTTSVDTAYDGTGVWLPHLGPALPHLDIVMSSLEEARGYTGKETPEDIADFYLSHGAGTALIKLGPEGVYARRGDESVRLPAFAVEAVDTTGAGDAACAGFLYGHLHDWPLADCARLANACGALTVTHVGAAGAVVSFEQVQAFMEEAINA